MRLKLQPSINDALASAQIVATVCEAEPLGEYLRVEYSDAKAAVRILKNECGMNYYIDIFGIDIEAKEADPDKDAEAVAGGVDVVVHLRKQDPPTLEDVILKTRLPYGGTWTSIWEDYPAALMPEREMCEMFGLKLAGHPNPKRLLTTDELPPMLLKSSKLRTIEEVRDK